MSDITLEATVTDGKIIFKKESEIKELALKILGSAENIYSEEIPIGNNIVIEFDDNHFSGWILDTLNSDCI